MAPKEGELHPTVMIPGSAARGEAGWGGPFLALWRLAERALCQLCPQPAVASGHLWAHARCRTLLKNSPPSAQAAAAAKAPDPAGCPSHVHLQGLVSTQQPCRRPGARSLGPRPASSPYSSSSTSFPSCLTISAGNGRALSLVGSNPAPS